MQCGSSSESDGSSDPPVSNGAMGGWAGYWAEPCNGDGPLNDGDVALLLPVGSTTPRALNSDAGLPTRLGPAPTRYIAAGFSGVSSPPVQRPSSTFDLSITDVLDTHPLLLGPPSPILYPFDEVQDHVATSTSYVDATDIDMLPFAAHPGENTRPIVEASGLLQGTRPLAHDFPVSVPSQDNVYEELRQSLYDRGLTSEAFRLPEMLFHGFGLGDALRNDFHRLADHDRGAWPANPTFEVPQKLAIVFCFPGYKKHSRQVNVLRHVRGGTLPQTRSKLAHIIAEEMHTFLTRSRQSGQPLVHGNRELDVDDLVLLDIQHISKGSLQPTIGVVVRPPHSTIST
ncbi:hypothetical protein K466DRAFT_597906 [Polyporus arcularius HHB13444]|uniref:Uncharacterized protein n=1 Tax=Polyporus arcularius HHB13444 TaxID=1314778 RepID=A0A5C3PK90_9APHY|nr:hypothetical protein K466DRAFT_597906 [Polyporus arcularius HHB13444]